MKKFVKPLIIAASVAAIAGIGAVSFAAWQGSTVQEDASASVGTGNITVNAGFVSDNPVALTLTGGKLVPVDQATPGTGNTTMLTATLGDIQVVKGTYSFTLAADTSTDLKLYYQVAAAAPTLPTFTPEAGSTVEDREKSISDQLTDWTALGTATSDVTVTDNVATVDDLSLYIVLVSSDTADMNATAALTLTLNSTAA